MKIEKILERLKSALTEIAVVLYAVSSITAREIEKLGIVQYGADSPSFDQG